jgi:O-antigen ligase
MGYAGVNGLAAFEAQAAAFLLAMAFLEKRFWYRIGYLSLAVYSVLCLMYSLSRGAYAAFLAAWIFLGAVKQRTLLVLLALFVMVWTTVVPNAVVMRVQMTKDQDGRIDHSSELRIALWEDAMQLIRDNPITGTGFNTYAYMHRVGTYADTHNYYIKVLVETGVVGLLLFVWLLTKSMRRGWVLFRRASDPFFRGLGLGLMGWVTACAVSNGFGDRWTYLQIQGFFWVLAALVARGWMLHEESASEDASLVEPGSDEATCLVALPQAG